MNSKNRIVVNSFINSIIDYAGLFPPANISLKSAFTNYISYKNSENKNILSRFICPAKLFPELGNLLKSDFQNEEVSLSVLGKGGESTENFLLNFKEDLKNWTDFKKIFGDSVITNSFEIKLPDDLILSNDSKRISDFISQISLEIKNETGNSVFIFFECLLGSNWKNDIKHFVNSININNNTENYSGFKLRTGGVTPKSFPDSEIIAFSIKECLDSSVPMKCTAGLHHPFRHFDREIGVMMHGFINVFGAGIIAMRHNISHSELIKILNDDDPGNFIFTDEYFSWNDYKISVEDIKLARNKLMISFGSCSFDDPVNDLKNLNLL